MTNVPISELRRRIDDRLDDHITVEPEMVEASIKAGMNIVACSRLRLIVNRHYSKENAFDYAECAECDQPYPCWTVRTAMGESD